MATAILKPHSQTAYMVPYDRKAMKNLSDANISSLYYLIHCIGQYIYANITTVS